MNNLLKLCGLQGCVILTNEKEQWFESGLLFLSVVFLALAFPLQVLAKSPLPALFPYVLLALAWMIRVFARLRNCGSFKELLANGHPLFMDWVALMYASLVFFHMSINLILGTASWIEMAANTVNFLFPLFYYVYFRLFADSSNVKSIMSGILLGCLIVSAYSVSHAYMKMTRTPTPRSIEVRPVEVRPVEVRPVEVRAPQSAVSEEIVWHEKIFRGMEKYQLSAGEYSQLRINAAEDYVNKTMRSGGPRSAGLLESHSVSSAWIGLGLFASLGLIPLRLRRFRYIAICFFMGFFLVFQYYTGIFSALAALTVVLLSRRSERQGMKMLGWSLARAACLLAIIFALVYFIILGLNDHYLNNLRHMALVQHQLFFGGGDVQYLKIVLEKLRDYLAFISNTPWLAAFGDGLGIYYPYSFSKGGDVGFVESLARLGIPLLALVFGALLKWIYDFIFRGRAVVLGDGNRRDGLLIFALGSITFILFNDIHYSIWPAKSVFPILMVAFALCSKKGQN